MADDKKVTAIDLELEAPVMASDEALNLRQIRDNAEKAAIVQAVSAAENNMAKASRMLGVSRPTLYSMLEKHGLDTGK